MNELDDIMAKASEAVGQKYFRLPIFGADPVYRERVYCYELYHQLRLKWPDTHYFLSGEVDKSGHAHLQGLGVAYEKPDFLIHDPGSMDNHAIIEVKHAEAQISGIDKDLKTLDLFKNKVGYTRAIYLIYGEEVDEEFVKRITDKATALKTLGPIEIWTHRSVGAAAKHSKTIALG